MITYLKTLENLNDFPKIGLIYMENSGENLLRYYLEKVFHIKTGMNIKREFYKEPGVGFESSSDVLETNWIIASDFPYRNKAEYNSINISSAILIIRNPVDLIMSKILRESYFLEDALIKIDQMIEEWKVFYKYWTNAPIPVHIVRYEDLIYDPKEIMKQSCMFLLGMKTIENTKLEYAIRLATTDKVDKHYFAYDVQVEGENNILNGDNVDKIQNKFNEKLNKFLRKFNYEVNSNGDASNWMAEFNVDNLVKSVEFHDFLNSQYLTSCYFNIKLG